MMLKNKKNILIYNFFEHYVMLKVNRHFSRFVVSGEVKDAGKPILLLANHNSWWDGLWASCVNTRLFRRRFHFMMLEEQLRKYAFFRYTGGYSVKKGSREVLESLHYTLELLKVPRNMVLLFPQGRLESLYVSDFHFEKGLEVLLGRAGESIQVVMMAALVDYFSEVKPGLYIYLREYLPGSGETPEAAYTRFYKECLSIQTGRREG